MISEYGNIPRATATTTTTIGTYSSSAATAK